MPLFSYACKKCGHTAEVLARPDETVPCPACGAKNMEKQMSQITPKRGGGASPGHVCHGCCGASPTGGCPSMGGACGLT